MASQPLVCLRGIFNVRLTAIALNSQIYILRLTFLQILFLFCRYLFKIKKLSDFQQLTLLSEGCLTQQTSRSLSSNNIHL